MKRFFSLMLAVVAAVCITSCHKSGIEEGVHTNESNQGECATLFAAINNSSTTRVAVTDNGTEGLSFAWEEGDALIVTHDNTMYTFVCEDLTEGRFVCEDETFAFKDGVAYTAKFGGSPSTNVTQDNTDNSFSNDEGLSLSADFTYIEGRTPELTFSGDYPIITIKLPDASEAYYNNSVIFYNGNNLQPFIAQGSFDRTGFTANIVIEEVDRT